MKKLFHWLLAHGQRPYAITCLAALSVFDSVLPVMPSEFLALALMILQPHRKMLIAVSFACAAALSAGLLATLLMGIAQTTALTSWLEVERQAPAWSQALSLIQDWDKLSLTIIATFPDSPRAAVAVAALAGFSPLSICIFVLAGKLVLYSLLILTIRILPKHLKGPGRSDWLGAKLVRRATLRFAAIRRLLKRLEQRAQRPQQ